MRRNVNTTLSRSRLEAVCPTCVEHWWYPGELSIRGNRSSFSCAELLRCSSAQHGGQDQVCLADWPAQGADVAPSAAEDEGMAAGVALGLVDTVGSDQVSCAGINQWLFP